MTQLRGIFAAMCTPFEKDGETVDPGRYRDHIDDMIQAGMHGIVLCSGTGEYAYLSDEERAFLIREGARHIDGRVPTVAQTTALSTADCVARAQAAEDAGVTAVMVMPPFLEPPGERGVFCHYETIARAIGIPVVMYNVPQQAAPLTLDLYRRLIAVDNLDYIKDSSGDFTQLQKLVACGGGVLNGTDAYAPYSLMAGCVGMIWGAANFMPRECVRLHELIVSGEHAQALALWASMRDACLWLWDNDRDVDYMSGVKAATCLSGRDMGPPRQPLPLVSGSARRDLLTALSKLPVDRSKPEQAILRDWQEERDQFMQSRQRC